MARGARFKWTPKSSALCGPVAFVPDQAEKDILSYLLLSTRQGVDPGAKLLLSYVSSQVNAGMCPVAIVNRVELLRRITWENAQGHIAQLRISRTCASLRKTKANAGGPKRKALLSIETLLSFLLAESRQFQRFTLPDSLVCVLRDRMPPRRNFYPDLQMVRGGPLRSVEWTEECCNLWGKILSFLCCPLCPCPTSHCKLVFTRQAFAKVRQATTDCKQHELVAG